ncbi:hypothetical protein C1H46_035048 [Malus baccata]|uniref:Uncharacterized protein n=1 Tax=Malus baccata TaxID=106549 RepID=A0A540KYV4_MALBA|nr:hypothetical protein C1H46_035048 [Malus baccata]
MTPLRKPLPHLLFTPKSKSSSFQSLASYFTLTPNLHPSSPHPLESPTTRIPNPPQQPKPTFKIPPFFPIPPPFTHTRSFSIVNSDPSQSIPVVSTVTSPHDSSQPIDAGSSIRKSISLWPGMYSSPVTNALWEARSKMYGDASGDAPPQSELVARTPAQSRTSILYNFSSDYKLRE